MSSLSDLADDASRAQVSTVELLRRLKVIASRSDLPPLAEWVQHELGGYDTSVALPPYRGPFPAPAYGQYSGPFGRGATNVPIPPLGFREEFRGGPLFNMSFAQPVAELEDLLSHADGDTLSAPWPADALASVDALLAPGARLGDGMSVLVGAHQKIPRTTIGAVVSAVRDRVLDLALELDRTHNTLNNEREDSSGRSAQQSQVITAVVYGNAAFGSSDFKQLIRLDTPKSQPELFDRLRDLGIDEEALSELDKAIAADSRETAGKGSVGHRVSSWIGRHADKAVGAAVGASAGVAGTNVAGTVAQLIQTYLHSR